jgi:CPA2 family monovalent cation:H+ antiporter-2
MISASVYAQQALAHLFPLRDSFVAPFFVTMGLLIDPKNLVSNLPLLGTMIGLIPAASSQSADTMRNRTTTGS